MKTSITSFNERFCRHLRAASQNIYAAAHGDVSLWRLPCIRHVNRARVQTRSQRESARESAPRCSISHIRLQDGTFPGKRRRLTFTSVLGKGLGEAALLRCGEPGRAAGSTSSRAAGRVQNSMRADASC